MTGIVVGMADLRDALAAVSVHASKDEELPELCRVRLSIEADYLIVSASDRYTIGMACVSIHDRLPKGMAGTVIELLVSDTAKIRTVHKPAGKEQGESPEYLLRLDIGSKTLTLTDSSGMLDGRSLAVPILPRADALDSAPGLVAAAQGSDPVGLEDMSFRGPFVARFATAATTYGELLELESREGHRAILIRAGESFIGLLMPFAVDESHVIRRKEWATGWDERLTDMLTRRDGDDQ